MECYEPPPALRHQRVSRNIKYELKDVIRKASCKNCKVYDFIDIKEADDTILQPGTVVICKDILKPFLDFFATLLLEILSPSTAIKDNNNKFYIYNRKKSPIIQLLMLIKTKLKSIILNKIPNTS